MNILVLIVLSMMDTMPHTTFGKQYSVTDLGTLGGDMSMAFAINNKDCVIGTSSISDGTFHPFIWHNGTMTDLGDLGATFHGVRDINDNGQIVGHVFIKSGIDHAFIWDPGGGMTGLGVLQGTTNSWANGVNNQGQVVGGSSSIGDTRPFLSDRINGAQDLLLLAGVTQGVATDINNNGEIIGSWNGIPFLWDNVNGLQVLETLAGTRGSAIAINDHGQIAGNSSTAEGFIHACLWNESHRVHDLRTLPDREISGVWGINNHGDVVGYSFKVLDLDKHAFLWTDGAMHDLNDFVPPESGWELLVAKDINDARQIVGWGKVDLDGDGTFDEIHAFLLTNGLEPNAGGFP